MRRRLLKSIRETLQCFPPHRGYTSWISPRRLLQLSTQGHCPLMPTGPGKCTMSSSEFGVPFQSLVDLIPLVRRRNQSYLSLYILDMHTIPRKCSGGPQACRICLLATTTPASTSSSPSLLPRRCKNTGAFGNMGLTHDLCQTHELEHHGASHTCVEIRDLFIISRGPSDY